MSTPIFQPVPSVMFVGSDDDLATECAEALPHLPLLRVVHAAAAVERMLVTRPLVVVIDESLTEANAARVVECASDIRAEVLRPASDSRGRMAEPLRAAVLAAERARAAPP
jgi:hypothetical protein